MTSYRVVMLLMWNNSDRIW